MAKLNDYNDRTKKEIHLLVTSLCDRNCKYCCNKQYDLNDVPYVTNEELQQAETIYITGGEPFIYSNPTKIALWIRDRFRNIKNIFVYTGAWELAKFIVYGGRIEFIDGVTVSIKTKWDKSAFELYIVNNLEVKNLRSNMLYVFDDLYPEKTGNFMVRQRVWQEDFEANPNSVFRKI